MLLSTLRDILISVKAPLGPNGPVISQISCCGDALTPGLEPTGGARESGVGLHQKKLF